MEFSEIFRSQRETNFVRFPAEMMLALFDSFSRLDNETAQIDLNVVEEFFVRLSERRIGEKWLRVFDDGANVCLMEIVDEGGKKRVKCTNVDCVSGKLKGVLVYLARKKRASIEDLAAGVWFDESTKRKVIANAVSALSGVLLAKNYPFQINSGSDGRYEINFLFS